MLQKRDFQMLQCHTPDVTYMKEIVRFLMIFYAIFVTIKFWGGARRPNREAITETPNSRKTENKA